VGYTFNQYSPPDGSAIRPPLNGVKPFSEKLKSDWHPEDDQDHDDSNEIGGGGVEEEKGRADDDRINVGGLGKKTTKIAFQDEVEVVPIPTRYEYSDRIKSRIWSNRHELQENAERNALEFAAEGWNWRNVTEDEGMYICSVSGELVHPIHLQHLVGEQQPQQQQQDEEARQQAQQQQQQQQQEQQGENVNGPSVQDGPQLQRSKGLERGAPVH